MFVQSIHGDFIDIKNCIICYALLVYMESFNHKYFFNDDFIPSLFWIPRMKYKSCEGKCVFLFGSFA